MGAQAGGESGAIGARTPKASPCVDATTATDDRPPSRLSRRRRRARCQYVVVEPGSIYAIMHRHAGTSLFLKPICWTDQHAQLLGARWLPQPRIVEPRPVPQSRPSSPSMYHTNPSPAADTLGKELSTLFNTGPALPFYSVFPIRHVFSTLYPRKFGRSRNVAPGELNIWFGGRAYKDAVRAQCVWTQSRSGLEDECSFRSETTVPANSFLSTDSSESSSSAAIASSMESPHERSTKPILAYLGRKQLAAVRNNLYRVVAGPRRTPNLPVARLQMLRSKALTPSNLDCDPLFVGALIAMAQAHFYPTRPEWRRPGVPSAPVPCPDFHDVTVHLLTTDVMAQDFIVYTATITKEFLYRFHYPAKASRSSSEPSSPTSNDVDTPSAEGIEITYTRTATWPIVGLKERLGKALGTDVVGDFDEINYETWAPAEPNRLKRGHGRIQDREALVEVFNRSFDEDLPEVSPGAKRRRISEGGPLEVR